MCVSRDGQELFVSSDRDEPGKLRIYRFWWADGSWQGPEKLGAAVNSGAGDMQPFLMADESYLLWTSQRGGYPQIYRAARLGENEWGPAELVVSGPPVGSPSLTDDGRLLCFAALAPAMGGFEADVYCARAE
ncbi:MAG: PD40 domain-containing protein [Deltaproteobacteria bacterium]|nr:PD40 domain-containing protein [Deltaproteobacteria bacterium]